MPYTERQTETEGVGNERNLQTNRDWEAKRQRETEKRKMRERDRQRD